MPTNAYGVGILKTIGVRFGRKPEGWVKPHLGDNRKFVAVFGLLHHHTKRDSSATSCRS